MPKKDAYAKSGVDIAAGNKAVDLIKEKAGLTFPLINQGKVLSDLGGFGAIIELDDGRIIVATTDGVGTKIVIAILLYKHETVGIDLGAMCYNDLAAVGVQPLLFMDYIVQGVQTPAKTALIVDGIIEGCHQASTPLVGGEMAECPDLYEPEVYDMAGFSIGMADSIENLILGDETKPGMFLYGLPSNGLHSNGFSLVRDAFGIHLADPLASIRHLREHIPELGCELWKELLRPTKIYTKDVMRLIGKYPIVSMSNITGGGLEENPVRTIPNGCGIKIDMNSWEPLPIFKLLQEKKNLSTEEMLRSTNYGIGFTLISPEEIDEPDVIKIGRIIESEEKKVFFDGL